MAVSGRWGGGAAARRGAGRRAVTLATWVALAALAMQAVAGLGATPAAATQVAAASAAAGGARTPASTAAAAREVVAERDIVYSTRFTWPVTAGTWERALNEPLLMWALWDAYGFAPAYRVTGTLDSLRVVDPTGLVGDAFVYERGGDSVHYLVLGKLNHWAVPVLNKGLAVFDLRWQAAGDGIAAELDVHVQAGSGLGSLVLRLVRPLLARHVANRVSANLLDAQTILVDVERDPAGVMAKLEGEARVRFAAVFGGAR